MVTVETTQEASVTSVSYLWVSSGAKNGPLNKSIKNYCAGDRQKIATDSDCSERVESGCLTQPFKIKLFADRSQKGCPSKFPCLETVLRLGCITEYLLPATELWQILSPPSNESKSPNVTACTTNLTSQRSKL